MLINALLKFGPGQEVVEFRLHLRYEFLMLGIIPLIEKLEEYENEDLNLHLTVFKLQREKDEQLLRDKIKDNVSHYYSFISAHGQSEIEFGNAFTLVAEQ